MANKSKIGSPAHRLMSGSKCYAEGGHASGDSKRAMGGPLPAGGRLLYRPNPRPNPRGFLGGPYGPRAPSLEEILSSPRASTPKGFATGGAPTADTSLRRGGRRSRHASGDTVNAHTGHPGYGFLDSAMKGLKAGVGNMIRAHYGMDPGFAEGGHAARGGRLFQREFSNGGKTLRKGGRRYADGGTAQPLQGMANQVAPVVAPNDRMANLAYGTTPPTGRDTSNSDNNQTPTMKRGGRRSRHAAGEAVRDQATHSMHRAMGGAGKTRKHYPYT
jgi:hypothetical protein